MRAAVASDGATPVEVLVSLARDKSVLVRRALATNESAPDEALRRLGVDGDELVLAGVARNRSASHDVQVEALRRLEERLGEERLLSDEEIRRIEEETRRIRQSGS